MLAGINRDSCGYICKKSITYGSALIGITFFVIGILALVKCSPFASFAHTSALGGSSIVLAFIVLSLSLYYIFSQCVKSEEVYVQVIQSVDKQSELSGKQLLEKFLERKLNHLQKEEFVGSEELYLNQIKGKSIAEFNSQPVLVLIISEQTSCALQIPHRKKSTGEERILIFSIKQEQTQLKWKAVLKTNTGCKRVTSSQSDILKFINRLV